MNKLIAPDRPGIRASERYSLIERLSRKLLPKAFSGFLARKAQKKLLPYLLPLQETDIASENLSSIRLSGGGWFSGLKPQSIQQIPPPYIPSEHFFTPLQAWTVPQGHIYGTFVLDQTLRCIADLGQPRLLEQRLKRGTTARTCAPEHIDLPAVFLGNSYMDNYHHWMHDMISQLLLYGDLSHACVVFPLRYPYQRESLLALGIDASRILDIRPHELIRFRSVTAFQPHSPLTGHPDSVRGTAQLKQRLSSGPGSVKRLFINRKDAGGRRNIRNTDEVAAMLRQYGFTSVAFTELSLREGCSLVDGAEAIVLPHGAALSNLAFCRPGTKVMEIVSPRYVVPIVTTFAKVLELDFHIFIGSGAEPQKNPDYAGYTVDIPLFREAVEYFLS